MHACFLLLFGRHQPEQLCCMGAVLLPADD